MLLWLIDGIVFILLINYYFQLFFLYCLLAKVTNDKQYLLLYSPKTDLHLANNLFVMVKNNAEIDFYTWNL